MTVSCLRGDERLCGQGCYLRLHEAGGRAARAGQGEEAQSRTFGSTGPKEQLKTKSARGPSRFRTVETTVNGRKERITPVPARYHLGGGSSLSAETRLFELPEVGLEEEYAQTSQTAHFEASSRPTGWGWLTSRGGGAREGEVLVERVSRGASAPLFFAAESGVFLRR